MLKFLQKYFTTGLLAYLLFLAVLPCVDDCTVEYCQAEGIVHMEKQHSDDHNDLCSPLCNCLCCNTLVSLSVQLNLNIIKPSKYIEFTIHSNILPLSYKPTSPPPKV